MSYCPCCGQPLVTYPRVPPAPLYCSGPLSPDLVQDALNLISQIWRQIGDDEVRWGLYWISSFLAARGSFWAEQELRKWIDRHRRHSGLIGPQ